MACVGILYDTATNRAYGLPKRGPGYAISCNWIEDDIRDVGFSMLMTDDGYINLSKLPQMERNFLIGMCRQSKGIVFVPWKGIGKNDITLDLDWENVVLNEDIIFYWDASV